MGLNMPAKTVIFTAVRKFDGTESRWLTSGEYIQMSGRAGRRGKDEKGLCIMMVDETLDLETCQCALQPAARPWRVQPQRTACHQPLHALLGALQPLVYQLAP